jgi:hypothetical protein
VRKIEYEEGQILGDYGVVYLKEVESRRLPCGDLKRRAEFKCGMCGDFFITEIQAIKLGSTKSCGCERIRKVREACCTHKCTGHPLFNVWRNIKERCYNDKHKAYKNYGGRGIKMYEGWLNDPRPFIEYVENLGWEKGLEVDRIDNDGNYEPDNLRVVTHYSNNQNTRLINKRNTLGFRGIGYRGECWKNPYKTSIMMNRIYYHLNSYPTPQQAAQAYDVAVILLDGLHPRNFKEYELGDYDPEVVEKVKNKIKELK